jgi:hypothetical protein
MEQIVSYTMHFDIDWLRFIDSFYSAPSPTALAPEMLHDTYTSTPRHLVVSSPPLLI